MKNNDFVNKCLDDLKNIESSTQNMMNSQEAIIKESMPKIPIEQQQQFLTALNEAKAGTLDIVGFTATMKAKIDEMRK